MQKLSSHFTDKMDYLFKDIVDSLGHLPMEQRSFLFGYEDEVLHFERRLKVDEDSRI